MAKKPSIFVSYAHEDSFQSAQRLVRALEPYCSEIFWDRKLRAGDWRNQLKLRIMSLDFFVVIMSSRQSQSKMCQWELRLARERLLTRQDDELFEIVPIKKSNEYKDPELEKLQYADFTGDFEKGFSDLSQIIFGKRQSSWEYLSSASPKEILVAIQKGVVPTPIVLDACEWLIIKKVWGNLHDRVSNAKMQLFVGDPQTPEDVLVQIDKLIPQMADRLDAASIVKLQKAQELVNNYETRNSALISDDLEGACRSALILIADVNNFLREEAAARLDAREVINVDANFATDVASALRQSIKKYSRGAQLTY